jgi:hypothetical protein
MRADSPDCPLARAPQRPHSAGAARRSCAAALVAALTVFVGAGCVAESSEGTAADASFRNVFPVIPADTSNYFEPAGRPMPEELGREQTYIPCATNRDCFRQTGPVDFGDSGQEHGMPCGTTQRRSNFCVRTTVGEQRYTACMPTSSGVSVWIADYCPGRRTAPWEQPENPQCDVCDSWAGGGACPLAFSDPPPSSSESYLELMDLFQRFDFAVRAFPEFDSNAGTYHQTFASPSCQGLYCRSPADCPSGLECICVDDNATPPGLYGREPGEAIVYCNAGSPGCKCRGADSEITVPGACLWPTYEGAAPEGAAP